MAENANLYIKKKHKIWDENGDISFLQVKQKGYYNYVLQMRTELERG